VGVLGGRIISMLAASAAVKVGNRFAALQPIAQGLQAEFGTTAKGAGRGLRLRMDHGTQYTADDFLKQIEFRGIDKSFAFVAEPRPTAWPSASTGR
jgi:putative transposase